MSLFPRPFKSLIKSTGERAEFSCQLEMRRALETPLRTNNVNVTWKHQTKLIAISEESFSVNSVTRNISQYTMSSASHKEFFLSINNITSESTGSVQCIIDGCDNTLFDCSPERTLQETYLFVRFLAREIFPSQMQDQTAEGGTATFICQMGFQVAHLDLMRYRLRWRHQGRLVHVPQDSPYPTDEVIFSYMFTTGQKESAMIINKVSRKAAGSVQCELRWGPGTDDFISQSAYLHVRWS